VSIDKDHNSKGYGYIQFKESRSATNAIKEVRYKKNCNCIDE